MRSARWPVQVHHIACCLLAFSIPFWFNWAAISIWLVVLGWLLQGRYKSSLLSLKSSPGLLLFVLYFVLHALSYFYSTDKDQSLFDIVSKLSFVLLPLLIGAEGPLPDRKLEEIIASFCAGIGITAIICMANATIAYSSDKLTTHFFYHDLVRGFDANAVYMAWYALFALGCLLFFKWQFFRSRWKYLRIALLVIIFTFFVLLSSRLLLVIFVFIVLPLYTARLWRSRILSRMRLTALVGLVLVAGAVAVFTHNPIRKRFADVAHSNIHTAFLSDYHNRTPPSGNLITRLFLWRMGLDCVREQNLWAAGCGNGDAHSVINHKMQAIGIADMDEKSPNHSNYYNVNLHNMYLQSLVMLGIPGLIVFVLMVFLPFFYLKRTPHREVFIIFHVVAVLFMFQEAALQTQAGIVFYTFFSVIFWRLVKSASINKPYTFNVT